MPHADRAPESKKSEVCAPAASHSQARAKRLTRVEVQDAAQRVRAACEATQTSQAELAASLGVASSMAQALVEGRVRFGLDHLLTLERRHPRLAAELWRRMAPQRRARSLPLDRAALMAGAKTGAVQTLVLQALGNDGQVDEREAKAIRQASAAAARAHEDVEAAVASRRGEPT